MYCYVFWKYSVGLLLHHIYLLVCLWLLPWHQPFSHMLRTLYTLKLHSSPLATGGYYLKFLVQGIATESVCPLSPEKELFQVQLSDPLGFNFKDYDLTPGTAATNWIKTNAGTAVFCALAWAGQNSLALPYAFHSQGCKYLKDHIYIFGLRTRRKGPDFFHSFTRYSHLLLYPIHTRF